jgi:hypothetical protein
MRSIQSAFTPMMCTLRKRSPDVLATLAPATKALEYASQGPCSVKECLFSETDDDRGVPSAFSSDQMWRSIAPFQEHDDSFPAITWDLEDEVNGFIEAHTRRAETISSEISILGNSIIKQKPRRPSSHRRTRLVRSRAFKSELDSMSRYETKRRKLEENSVITAFCNHDLPFAPCIKKSFAKTSTSKPCSVLLLRESSF